VSKEGYARVLCVVCCALCSVGKKGYARVLCTVSKEGYARVLCVVCCALCSVGKKWYARVLRVLSAVRCVLWARGVHESVVCVVCAMSFWLSSILEKDMI